MTDPRAAYEAWHAALPVDEGAEAPWHDLVRGHLPDVTGLRILEVGCGRGGFSEWLARQGPAVVVGADFALTAVRMAATFGRAAGHRGLWFEVADMALLPHAGATFDLVVSCETVEHLPDPVGALRGVANALRSGGTLLLTTPNYTGVMGLYRLYRTLTGRGWAEVGQPINRWTHLPRTCRWVRQAGLRVTAIDSVGHYVPIPRRPPLRLDAGATSRPGLRWLGLHSLVIAEKP